MTREEQIKIIENFLTESQQVDQCLINSTNQKFVYNNMTYELHYHKPVIGEGSYFSFYFNIIPRLNLPLL